MGTNRRGVAMSMSDEELLAILSNDDRRAWPSLDAEEKAGLRDIYTPRRPPTDELRALAHRLFDRWEAGDGQILLRQHLEGAQMHECFANAMAWLNAHPGHALLYGFLLLNFGARVPYVRFVPHVAVYTDEGEWLDVTPSNTAGDYLFLPHRGTEQEFSTAFNNGPMDFIYC